MTRIAVAGAGLVGRRHIELIRSSDECRLASVVDPAPAAEALAAELDVSWHASLEALLADDSPDGIIVATPSQLHLDHALACLTAAVPVLVEKPVATSVEDGVRIARAADAADVALLVGHHRRHGSILRTARRVIQEGALGRVVAVTGAAMLRKPDDYFDAAPWRRLPGGGPLLINMIHEVDDLRYLCGEIVSVQAQASSAVRGFEVEDTVAITLAFAGGALGSFMLSDVAASAVSWELTSAENPAYPHVPGIDCYVIAGDVGSLGVPTMRLARYPGAASWWEPLETDVVPAERRDPLVEQLRHFCAVIRGEVDPAVTAWDGVQDLFVVEAIAEAGRTGSVVPTPDLRGR